VLLDGAHNLVGLKSVLVAINSDLVAFKPKLRPSSVASSSGFSRIKNEQASTYDAIVKRNTKYQEV
jgi:hypothetical protein